MENTIFYFTGTGNSLQITKYIAANLQNCEMLSISKNINIIKNMRLKGTVGFVFPVYYCGLPQIVREALTNINLDTVDYIFTVAAYGSTGGNGGCISMPRKILSQKRKKLDASFYIKTVDNFILWSWDIPSAKKHVVLHERAKEKASEIAGIINNKQKHSDKSIMEYIGPIVFRYNRFVKTVNTDDKSFYATPDCAACGLCEKVCPTQNIKMNCDKPNWKSEKCQRCLSCLHLCPRKAIEYGEATKKKTRYKNPYISLDEFTNIH